MDVNNELGAGERGIQRLKRYLLKEKQVFLSDKIEAKEIDGRGIGVIAIDHIMPEEVLVRFPVNSLINPRTVLAYEHQTSSVTRLESNSSGNTSDDIEKKRKLQQRKSLKYKKRLSSHQILSHYIYSLQQRKNQQDASDNPVEWSDFLTVLPSNDAFNSMPMTWKVLNLDYYSIYYDILPPDTLAHSQKVYDNFLRDFEAVERVCKLKLNKSQFLWAWLCVNTRCLYFYMSEARTPDDCMTMAPYIDFLNHSDESHSKIGVEDNYFHLIATKEYKVGDEVFLSYGAHTNSFLLCEYGFTMEGNLYALLDLTSEILNMLSPSKKRFLELHGYLGEYTINYESLSFRTEIALAVIQSPHSIFIDPLPNAREKLQRSQLEAFISGISDGQMFARESAKLLSNILNEIIASGETIIATLSCGENKSPAIDLIRLYKERINIAKYYLKRQVL
ncbi:hypothetical protein V1511DRAFT_492212 [Dipodascopsis uninucleata]